MGGFFGVASKKDCILELFYGVDYHSHLGTRRGGMAACGDGEFCRAIHNIENSPSPYAAIPPLLVPRWEW